MISLSCITYIVIKKYGLPYKQYQIFYGFTTLLWILFWLNIGQNAPEKCPILYCTVNFEAHLRIHQMWDNI